MTIEELEERIKELEAEVENLERPCDRCKESVEAHWCADLETTLHG